MESDSYRRSSNNATDEDNHDDDENDNDNEEEGDDDDENLWGASPNNTLLNDDSLTLPHNPDIPPPKVRVPYPIAAPQRPRQNNRNLPNRPDSTPSSLVNERLVTHIMSKMKFRRKGHERKTSHPKSSHQETISADSIQVRVVPDPLLIKQKDSTAMVRKDRDDTAIPTDNILDFQGVAEVATSDATVPPKENDTASSKKPKSIVMSLAEAIQLSLDEGKDLVEISIDQEIPVVTISSLRGIAYQSSKAKKGSKVSATTSSQLKEVTMKAGIADNDLHRKVTEIMKFIEKGHACTVTVRAGRKFTRVNENAAHDAVQRVLLLIHDKVEMVLAPEVSLSKNMAQFRVRAKKK
jgi:translation initiation factor IF-3